MSSGAVQMPPEPVLLRFEDKPQAVAVLDPIGIAFAALAGDGILRKSTGETVDFEGESIALTCTASGYHVRLVWPGDLPPILRAYVVPDDVPHGAEAR